MTQVKETITDRRKSPVVLLSVALDDIRISSDSFRVYFHIVRRVGKHEKAWPSYRSIGVHCFPDLKEDSARIKAIKAVKELIAWNLIEVEKNQTATGFHSNNYYLTDDSEWRNPDGNNGNSEPIPSSPTLPPPSSVTLPPSSPTLPIRDLQYKDFKILKDSQVKKDPPTPQGGMREISNSEIFVEEGDFRPEEEAIATPLQEPKQEAHTCQAQIPPDQINVPGGDENHSRFVTDTTAENMNTWNKIVATGAMKGERSPNPEFQEFYRQILSKTTQYKGRDCNLSHAKAALSRLWKQEPDRILAEAESWVKSKIKSSTSTQTRDAMSVPREERLARARAIQEAKQAQQQAKGA